MRSARALKRRESTEASPSSIVEDGFTLIEVLVSLTILSIVIFLVVGGMNVLVLSSALNRKQGNVGAVARRAAEIVRNDLYRSCTDASFGTTAPYPGLPTLTSQLPENASTTRVNVPKITKITTFNGQTTLWGPGPGAQNCSGANTSGIQIVQIEVDSIPAGITQTIYVTKAQGQ